MLPPITEVPVTPTMVSNFKICRFDHFTKIGVANIWHPPLSFNAVFYYLFIVFTKAAKQMGFCSIARCDTHDP